jgi:Glycosyltransferase family 87
VRRDAAAALVLLTAGWAATLWLAPWSDERVNDLFVYRSFAEPVLSGALPYRDVFFEYPPLAAPAIALPGLLGTGEETFRLAFAGWTLLLAGAVVLLCGALAERTGGSPRRALLAAALMPLACGALVRTHFDLAPVALVLAALLLLCAAHPRAGLALLGVGAMTKGFPLLVVTVAVAWLVARGELRAALHGGLACGLVIAAVAGASLAVSPAGAVDAVRYHLDRPVQLESSPALALLALEAAGAGEAVSTNSHRSDGLRHPADSLVSGAAAAALVGVLALLTALARPAAAGSAVTAEDGRRAGGTSAVTAEDGRRAGATSAEDTRPLVLASLAAVAAFVVLGKVLSPQFIIWILPMGALAFAWRMHALAATVAVAAILTKVEFPSRYFDLVDRDAFPLAVVTLRNAALLGALALVLVALHPRRQQQLLDRRRAALAVRLD